MKVNILLQLIAINVLKKFIASKIKSEVLIDKSAVAGFMNNADLNNKIATLATKAELKTR